MPTSVIQRLDRSPAPQGRAQRGVIVLMVMLIAMTAAMAVMLHGLNQGAARRDGERRMTIDALASAKRALIGYAVAYADGIHALDKGPGHLPCPDLDGGNAPGVAEAECRAISARETGRLPYRTLGLADLRDGSGAPLWYAVSDSFRSAAPSPLNSDTAGTLFVDAQSDIVAVVIAPGAALSTQARGAGDIYTPGAWLEDQNATPGDNHFVARSNGEFNDTVAFITRAELMAAVEPLVLREAGNALLDYYRDPDADDDSTGRDPECPPATADCDDGFPWLAPLADPVTGSYAGKVTDFNLGERAFGRLPLARLGVAFDTDFSASWHFTSILIAQPPTPLGSTTPSIPCMANSAGCVENFAATPVPVVLPSTIRGSGSGGWGMGRCTVTRAGAAPRAWTLECTTSYTFTAGTRTLRRDYQFTFVGNLRLTTSGPSARRTLRVLAAPTWPSGSSAQIRVTDFDLAGPTQIDFAEVWVMHGGASDAFTLTGVPFDLEVSDAQTVPRAQSPGALPNWFVANNWHHLVMAQFPCSASPGHAVASNCESATDSITVNVQRAGETAVASSTGVQGVVLLAGTRLNLPAPATVQVRPSALRHDYLEEPNASATTSFLARDPTSTFNDRLQVLQP